MSFNNAISLRIKQLLKLRHWTTYHLFGRSAVPNSTLSNILLGKCSSCTLRTLLNICRGFEITLKEFFDCELFYLENLLDD